MSQAPDVMVKKDLPADDGRRILTVRERQAIQQSIAIHSSIAQATEGSYGLATEGGTPVLPPGMQINKSRMSQKTKDLHKALQDGSPEPVAPQDRDRLAKRANDIKAILERDQVLETRAEVNVVKRDNPAFFTALKKAQMRPKYEGIISEYRNIMRRLEPNDELADSLDILRKER